MKLLVLFLVLLAALAFVQIAERLLLARRCRALGVLPDQALASNRQFGRNPDHVMRVV
jgi:hypothetical protein